MDSTFAFFRMLPFIMWLAAGLGMTACSSKNQALKPKGDPRLATIKLPEGFHIDFFAENLANARSLALGEKGTVFVGSRQARKVYALVDADGDGKAERRYTIAEKMNQPNGVAFHEGALYIAEIDKIWRIPDIESRLDNPGEPELVNDSLPSDTHHGWKYIAFGPDHKLYVPVGAPCNICDDSERDPRYASILRMDPDGSHMEIFAHGIRNTVGFTWHPETGALWFTDNGRDMLGDDIPPDELNVAEEPGQHFGYPFCHGNGITDPQFNKGRSCDEFKAPVAELAPHAAALGIKFNTGTQFPVRFRNQVFIAEHGSWNRSVPIGYRVMLVTLEGNSVQSYEPFAEGWLESGKAWGRPVDLLFLPDGSMLVSDDHANAVYRISYLR